MKIRTSNLSDDGALSKWRQQAQDSRFRKLLEKQTILEQDFHKSKKYEDFNTIGPLEGKISTTNIRSKPGSIVSVKKLYSIQ